MSVSGVAGRRPSILVPIQQSVSQEVRIYLFSDYADDVSYSSTDTAKEICQRFLRGYGIPIEHIKLFSLWMCEVLSPAPEHIKVCSKQQSSCTMIIRFSYLLLVVVIWDYFFFIFKLIVLLIVSFRPTINRRELTSLLFVSIPHEEKWCCWQLWLIPISSCRSFHSTPGP